MKKSLLNSADKKNIFERLSNVRPDSQRRWGRMTPHQMICHLSDSFRSRLGEKKNSSVSNVFTRTVMKWGALYAPLPWPHGIKTMPEMDQEIGGTPPDDFERDRDMSEAEWMRWGYLHCDHHLRQFGL
jgi:hypothetical protein